MLLAIRLWLRVDHCILIMFADGIVYCVLLKWMWRSSASCCRSSIIHITTFTPCLYNYYPHFLKTTADHSVICEVCILLIYGKTGRWFSPVSSANKTDLHDLIELLLKVVLNTINQPYVEKHSLDRIIPREDV
jgi:hypothetical protein